MQTNFNDYLAQERARNSGEHALVSFLSEVVWRDGDRNPGMATDATGMVIAAPAARNGIGWMVQAGYLLPRTRIELAGRYAQLHARGQTSLVAASAAGAGASYYLARHPLKLQAAVFRLDDDLMGSEPLDSRVHAGALRVIAPTSV